MADSAESQHSSAYLRHGLSAPAGAICTFVDLWTSGALRTPQVRPRAGTGPRHGRAGNPSP
jgi:hypothetical protein